MSGPYSAACRDILFSVSMRLCAYYALYKFDCIKYVASTIIAAHTGFHYTNQINSPLGHKMKHTLMLP